MWEAANLAGEEFQGLSKQVTRGVPNTRNSETSPRNRTVFLESLALRDISLAAAFIYLVSSATIRSCTAFWTGLCPKP